MERKIESDIVVLTAANAEDKPDPGAARLGNFINYYQFNPAKNRITHLPKDLLNKYLPRSEEESTICLDIGCNSGVSGIRF
jgi:hypothetical protein